ncbi:hypothetical protein QD712_25760 [Streptomyces acidiscabies]|uniref:hypothetical protein n=1 Tax=Streptomyces acidiscabies TaxID=42234 RepID=UPI0030D21E74
MRTYAAAQLVGDRTHQCDTTATRLAPDRVTRAYVLLDGIDQADLMAWLLDAERAHGEAVEVTPLADWKYRDPIEDACDKVGAEKVFVIPIDHA